MDQGQRDFYEKQEYDTDYEVFLNILHFLNINSFLVYLTSTSPLFSTFFP